uniref:Uncharacterized protein n=2 Tax=Palpitomonas bilix TaxID=652834 RepID=A0A7S3GCJ6_9EUKA|mmetsp:Transcript_43511/g.113268  ORF Transcript_43511/g.113268 Transcript_43511/m.113268 type:complete len:188 (+) Transcript_43511:296-859(+)|eukprot:CAMPEP_0113887090 /NCGR_PEP_ID=MMETSP0780_2-20120614/11978_1 /TAXON_ID=652834 /ORGANISM="Palpitomonas bilix" /LENGTH=187 /DNA_ID=CAMNT_0000875499 /DNA_START=236 /DNA_END=799 /DNA_ORIENTATION=+ /assembly_acc=CAM_ASM_000599
MAEGQRVETEMVEVSLHEEGRERVPELSEEQIAAMEEDPTYIPPLDEEGYIIPGAMDEEETEEDIWWTQRKLKPWAESTRWEKCKYCFTKCYRGIEVVGEKIAGVLGLTQSKYEWVIDEYERIQEQKEDARKRRQRRREREREEIARELSAREGGSRDMDGNGDQVAPVTEARVTGEKGEEQQAPQL